MAAKHVPLITKLMRTQAPRAVIFIRLLTGAVFFLEGTKKFLFPDDWGVGRFIKIGIPAPEVLAPFVGVVEIVCGLLVLWGLLTRLSALPLIAVISVAIATTKVPLLLNSGFWPMEDHARTDYSMLMALLFLAIVGGGKWSLDALLSKKPKPAP